MVSLVRNPPAFLSTRYVRIIPSVGRQIFQTAHNATRHLDRALNLLPRLRCTLHHHVLRHRTMVSRRLATNNSPLDRPTICYWPRPAHPLRRSGSSRRRLASTEGCCTMDLSFRLLDRDAVVCIVGDDASSTIILGSSIPSDNSDERLSRFYLHCCAHHCHQLGEDT